MFATDMCYLTVAKEALLLTLTKAMTCKRVLCTKTLITRCVGLRLGSLTGHMLRYGVTWAYG